MDWGLPAIGRRATVLLVGVLGLLSLATGVLHLAAPVPIPAVQPYLPEIVTDMAGFTGAMTGFIILFLAYLLQRGSRLAWYLTLVMLPLSAAQGIIQASIFSIPLIILSLAGIPLVALNRGEFTRPLSLDASQWAATVAVIGAFAYGTFGTFALRDQFELQGEPVETLLDAFYYTVITATTVGYGDVVATTQFARLFSVSVVIFAVASFAVALGTLLVPALEARFKSALGRMTDSQLESLDKHVIVVGVGDLTRSILHGLATETVLVITDDERAVQRYSDEGHRVLRGSATDEASLTRARLDRATAIIVATDDDGYDVLSILTIRELDEDVRVVAAATNRENEQKMRRAGADTVISPADIGGRMLATAAIDAGAVLEDQLVEADTTDRSSGE